MRPEGYGMSIKWNAAVAALGFVVVLVATALLGTGALSPANAAGPAYQFELAGPAKKSGEGKYVVSVRLVHLPDKKSVPKAVIFESKADMGPDGMATMGAPVKAMPESEPGVYPFEIMPGMAGNWALSLAAKVQGETDTVRGSVTVNLAP